MPLLELIMADAPVTKVKVVKERKRRGMAERRKRPVSARSKGARTMNPRGR